MHRSWRDLAAWSLCLSFVSSAGPARASRLPPPVHARDRGYDAPGAHAIDGEADDHQYQFEQFLTRPDIDCPRWDITVYDEEALAPGYWFVAPYQFARQKRKGGQWVGPHIYDQKGELIWSGAPLFNGWDVFGFTKRENVSGEDMLSLVFRHEYGAFLDQSYQIRKKSYISGDGFELNIHEFHVVDNSTRLLHMTSKELKTTRAISADIGFDGHCEVHFQGFEERDIETLEPTFKWFAEGIIPLDDTLLDDEPLEKRCLHSYDYLHCNSLDKLPDGDYIIGCRHSDTVYRISHKDGSIVWRFGGSNRARTDFEFDDHFRGQHDVKVWDANDTHILIGMLDNELRDGALKISNEVSRGLLISLNTREMRAEVVSRYPHPEAALILGRGSLQLLPNRNAFVGFVEHSFIAEFTHDGTLLMEAKVRPNTQSYRAYKFPWVGHPALPPDVYSVAFADEYSYRTNLYVSWNGATEVVTWRIFRANADGSKELIASTPKTGFETTITLDEYVSHVVVAALDRSGKELGQSKVTKTVGPAAVIAGLDAKEVEWIEKHPPWIVTFFEQPAVAFISGMLICAGMGLTGLAAWYFTRSVPTSVASRKGKTPDFEHDHLLKQLDDKHDSDLPEGDDDEEDSGALSHSTSRRYGG